MLATGKGLYFSRLLQVNQQQTYADVGFLRMYQMTPHDASSVPCKSVFPSKTGLFRFETTWQWSVITCKADILID